MKRASALLAILLILSFPPPSWGRGGGGCLVEGTLVLTPTGQIPIEKLSVGAPVWCVTRGRLQLAGVEALTAVNPEETLEISAAGAKLRVTPEHPLMVGPGEYRIAGHIKARDVVYLARDGRTEAVRVEATHEFLSERPAFNLLVIPGGTFIAEGFVVHNKGCFLPDSPILKPDGTEIQISAVQPGDKLLAFTREGRLVTANVKNIVKHEADEYILLKTDRETLRVTREHPFYVGKGTFRTVEALKPGDTIIAWDGQSLAEQRIVSLEKVSERVPVYNLQTDQPNTFFAGRLAVHNKGGGCFPAGTRITTSHGTATIENLAPGDEILGVTEDGRTVRTAVKSLVLAKGPTLRIETDGETLVATQEHPVGLWGGGFLPARELWTGDQIAGWKDARLVPWTIRGLSKKADEGLVFNLRVDEPHTFLAADFVVHNKGGGGSSHYSSGGSGGSGYGLTKSDENLLITIFGGMIILAIGLCIWSNIASSKGRTENLDHTYDRKIVVRKALKTEKLLKFLSQQDASMTPEELRKLAESTFCKLQECWEKRDYAPMKPLLMPALFAQHTSQLKGLVRNHEINRIADLVVEQVDLVNVRYTEKANHREFTVLFTASATDCYVDDRSDEFLRGDVFPARFQEFWTFQRSGDQWLLREIEQAGESDILKDENSVEMLTDETIKQIYGDKVGKEGVAGPWLGKDAEEKATRIDRMLNFLVQTDKLWDRQQMLDRARQVFLSVYLARESGDLSQVPGADLFPQVAGALEEQIRQNQMNDLSMEFRNLCVRKVDLVLVRNFADRARDEFTVRISAHAQKVSRKAGRVLSEQEYVTPFDEYWTFGRLDEQWKLKEVLPLSRGKKKMTEENVEEDSSPEQLKWYYRQTRAV